VLELDSVTLHAALVGIRLVVHAAHRLQDGSACFLALSGGQHILCSITLARPIMVLLNTSAFERPRVEVRETVLATDGDESSDERAKRAIVAFLDPRTVHGALAAVVLAVRATEKVERPAMAAALPIGGGLVSCKFPTNRS
jgi:hypothetical protein